MQVGAGVRIVQTVNNCFVFLVSGLLLKSGDFRNVLRQWTGVGYGFIAILGITPCLGFALKLLPLNPPILAEGRSHFVCHNFLSTPAL